MKQKWAYLISSFKKYAWLLVAVFIQSCRTYTYLPQVPQTPVTQPKELNVGWTQIGDLAAWQISYSPVNNFSLAIATNSDLINYYSMGFEAGAAYYNYLSTNINYGILTAYGKTNLKVDYSCDYGYGGCNNNIMSPDPIYLRDRNASLMYHKIVVQPYITVSQEQASVSIGVKGTWALYPVFSVKDSIYNNPHVVNSEAPIINEIELYQKTEGRVIALQPYISILAGGGNWQAFLCVSPQWITYTNISREYLMSKPMVLSIGLNRKISFDGKSQSSSVLVQ